MRLPGSRVMENTIVPWMFKRSAHPMRFSELLEANRLRSSHLSMEGKIPGVRISLWRAYLVFVVVWHLLLVPLLVLFHGYLALMDCHIAIILSVMFTLLFFGGFSLFKEWSIDRMALMRIQKAWSVHFPYHDFSGFHDRVAKIYSDALEEGIRRANLEMYVMNALSASH